VGFVASRFGLSPIPLYVLTGVLLNESVLVEGEATVTVEDETVSMSPGDALRVDPEDTRQIDAEASSLFVIAGAS